MEPNANNSLAGTWTHAHEEDQGNNQVFRPAGDPLPPSRGRVTLELNADGSMGRTGPGPDDRTTRSGGKWEVNGHKLILKPESGSPSSYDIVEQAPGRLMLKPSSL